MTERIPQAARKRRKPAAASKWFVAALSVGAGLGMVAGLAAANPAQTGPADQPATAAPIQPQQIVVVRVPAATGQNGQTSAVSSEPTVIRVPRAVPAQPAQQQTTVATNSGGS